MVTRIVIGLGVYLLVGLLLFVGVARWGHLSEHDAPEALRDIVLGWLVILIALPFIFAVERYELDLSWSGIARRFYRLIRPAPPPSPKHQEKP